MRLALYRITQEALTNVRKHARPDRVAVRLEYLPDAVRSRSGIQRPSPSRRARAETGCRRATE